MRAINMTLIFCMMTTGAAAKPPLRDVPQVDGRLLQIGIADAIRKNCPEISARMLRALRVIFDVKQHAIDLGYTEEEIDAYRKSHSEKARLKELRRQYLANAGVKPDQSKTYCDLGRAEIEKGGQIGALLRAN